MGKTYARPVKPAAIMLALVALLVLPRAAHAYIDPGTGGLFLQLLFGGVAGALIILKLYWSKLKNIFKRNKE